MLRTLSVIVVPRSASMNAEDAITAGHPSVRLTHPHLVDGLLEDGLLELEMYSEAEAARCCVWRGAPCITGWRVALSGASFTNRSSG